MNPRKPTDEEKKELIKYLLTHDYENDENEGDNIQGYVENAAIAVFDNYATGNPGYAGKMMVVVYDTGTTQTETYSWDSSDGTIKRDVSIEET